VTPTASLLAFVRRPLPPPSIAMRGVADTRRARLACLLCTAFRSAGSAHVAAIHHRATEAARAMVDLHRYTDAEADAHRATAIDVRDAVAALSDAQRTPVLVAVVRELLDGAPAACVALDRTVRDAAAWHEHPVTAEHEALAAAIVAREVRL
jgi:hypothetical protein